MKILASQTAALRLPTG